MNHKESPTPRSVLRTLAQRAMLERGFEPEFGPAAIAEVEALAAAAAALPANTRDLRHLPWCSIDNDDSRDLDQLTVAVEQPHGAVTLYVAVADVAGLVRRGSAIDEHARRNTTSVYTSGRTFPMLPERLSTDLTSLNPNEDRVAVVIEMTFDASGAPGHSSVYPAQVHNYAKLAYNALAAWIERTGPMPAPVAAVAGLARNIEVQHEAAQRMRQTRHKRGALSLQTLESRAVFDGELIRDLVAEESNVAKSLIEELMVAANTVTARFLSGRGYPSIRRVVRTPAHWDRIVELAAETGIELPAKADGIALERFLVQARERDPASFHELSLCVIKLLGRGEYEIELPGQHGPGHFGLAVADYAHSTAPNRRYPDLLIQRLLLAALGGLPCPYSVEELSALARHCSDQEVEAKKLERQLAKSAAAILLENRIGQTFDAIVTGAADKGTWIRLSRPPVEGKLERGFEGKRVGDRLRVRLTRVDVEKGYIDFARV